MPVINFQSQDYLLDITISNGKNNIVLGTAAILELVINENIFQWYSSGHIIIDNTYLNFFRYSDEGKTTIAPEKAYYKFRSDGRDTIHIIAKPEKNQQDSFGGFDLMEENWILELEGIIYDIEELPSNDTEKKQIKLYFHDKTYQMMTEKNIEFSTAKKGLELSGKDPYSATNNDRALRTGQAISELLKDAEFTKHCQLIGEDSNEFWNMGDDKNTVFYTSPSNARVSQDLQYLLDIHCGDESTGYDPCIFKLERNKEPGKARQFTLIPLQEYFKKAGKAQDAPGEYLLELFVIKSLSDAKDADIGSKINRTPIMPNVELKQNFYNFDFSTITSYQFMDLSPMDATRDLTNYFLVNYNIVNHQFNIQKDMLTDVAKHMQEKYMIELMAQDPEKCLFLPQNKFAKDGYNTTVRYTLNFTESSRKSEGRNKAILSALFKNMSIGFNAIGATIRQPGRFIGITQGKVKNTQDYDNRLEGQFFITQVSHIFKPMELRYYNDIVGVKFHNFAPDELEIPYDDDVEIMQ